MAAEEFANNENLGSVRQKLNGNAREINKKVDKVDGKGLSTNDYTNADKAKLQALGSGGNAPDLSGYVVKETGKSLVLDSQIDKLVNLVPTDNNYTNTEKAKLSGIATNATANSTDASLRNRSTHTGEQAISTVTNLQTELNRRPPTATDSPIKPTDVWYCTQAQYDALSTKVATRKYEIYES